VVLDVDARPVAGHEPLRAAGALAVAARLALAAGRVAVAAVHHVGAGVDADAAVVGEPVRADARAERAGAAGGADGAAGAAVGVVVVEVDADAVADLPSRRTAEVGHGEVGRAGGVSGYGGGGASASTDAGGVAAEA